MKHTLVEICIARMSSRSHHGSRHAFCRQVISHPKLLDSQPCIHESLGSCLYGRLQASDALERYVFPGDATRRMKAFNLLVGIRSWQETQLQCWTRSCPSRGPHGLTFWSAGLRRTQAVLRAAMAARAWLGGARDVSSTMASTAPAVKKAIWSGR